MTMTNKHENLPRPADELEELAAYYGSHDTADEMEDGELVDPRPMQTTSLRLPADVVEALKSLAQARGIRYTALIREIVEQMVYGSRLVDHDELTKINERLARIEAAVARQSHDAA